MSHVEVLGRAQQRSGPFRVEMGVQGCFWKLHPQKTLIIDALQQRKH